MKRIVLFAILLLSAGPALAQHQPYAGLEQRPIKALSQQEAEDLRNGRGMGFALAAELNGYPGPAHVLENADALRLSGEQRKRTSELFAAMKAETIPLGERLIAQESALDRAFADRTIAPDSLAGMTAAIGATRAALRAAHLRYHLAQVEILSAEQTHRYNELRGYGAGGAHRGHRPGGHHSK